MPVATVSIGGAKNAGLLAVRILAASDDHLSGKLEAFMQTMASQVEQKNDALKAGLAHNERP